MTKLLLVDDDKELAQMLQEYLEREEFSVTLAHDGEAGAAAALSGDYALAVLDVMMPKASGMDALSRIRIASDMPVIMLTAKGDDIDRIIGLEMGADDYVQKPCTPRELVARIRAVLRRFQGKENAPEAPSQIRVGPLTLCPGRRTAQWGEAALSLTSTEFNLLQVLAQSAGKAVSKSDLSEQAMGRPLSRFDRSIDVHMSSIRHKLGQREDGQNWIQTVRGVGYQLTRD